jgi:mono/diheme cytochrome c family protein
VTHDAADDTRSNPDQQCASRAHCIGWIAPLRPLRGMPSTERLGIRGRFHSESRGSGARVDTAMQLVTSHPKSADHSDFATLSSYLSALAWNPAPVRGSGEHLGVGQELYTHICAACHGPDGRGQASNRVPRIAGQHYPYLRRQVEEAARLHRDLAPPEMTSALRGMREPEKDALADYVSRLGNADALVDPDRPRRP